VKESEKMKDVETKRNKAKQSETKRTKRTEMKANKVNRKRAHSTECLLVFMEVHAPESQ
jgi:hypothetical protein